jgi:hypothetical protein
MKERLVLGMGFFAVGACVLLAGGARNGPAMFSLAISAEPAPVSFTLGTRSTGPAALLASGGSGYIEDSGSPFNTAIGWQALFNSTGGCNVAGGYQALYSNDDGSNNTAVGYQALFHNISGELNEAFGMGALYYNTTGSFNTAIGNMALEGNTTGFANTGVGSIALRGNSTGSYNTAIGWEAGENSGVGSYNIHIGANQTGYWNESNTIRIGIPYDADRPFLAGQNRCFISGIVETAFGSAAKVVGITNDGQLGAIPMDSLPTKGDPGPQGPAGPPGDGLAAGSFLFLSPGSPVPAGFGYVGSTFFPLTLANKKTVKLTVHVYQKQ